MEYAIIPSIIAHDQYELDERLKKIQGLSKTIQLDVMDRAFVKDTTFDFQFALPKKQFYEAHLMIKDPLTWVKNNKTVLSSVIVHFESIRTVKKFLEIKSLDAKIKWGIALNPETPIKLIRPFLEHINKILVMTVNPGKYGASFLEEMLPKIEELRRLMPNIDIEVDGGINETTLKQCKHAGANQFVVGSYLQTAQNIKQAFRDLESKAK